MGSIFLAIRLRHQIFSLICSFSALENLPEELAAIDKKTHNTQERIIFVNKHICILLDQACHNSLMAGHWQDSNWLLSCLLDPNSPHSTCLPIILWCVCSSQGTMLQTLWSTSTSRYPVLGHYCIWLYHGTPRVQWIYDDLDHGRPLQQNTQLCALHWSTLCWRGSPAMDKFPV